MATKTRKLRFLSRAVQQVNTVKEIPAIMRSLVASAMELTGSAGGTAGLMTNGRMVFTDYNRQGRIIPVHYEFPAGHGVPGWVIQTLAPYTSNDAGSDPHVVPEVRQALGFHSLADVPIISRSGTLLGCMEVHNKAGGRYEEDDVDLLTVLAASAAAALENAQLLSDREQAMQALRRSEERLRAMFDNAALGIVEVDSQLRFIAANGRACHILGYQCEELLGMTVHDLTFPEDRPGSDQINARLREGLIDRFDTEKRYQRKDGSPLWAHVTVSAIRDSAGRFVRGIGTIEDISERRRAEEALRLSRERFDQIAEQSSMVWEVDADGLYTYVSRASETILGRPPEELIGRVHFYDLHPQEGREEFKRTAFETFAAKGTFRDLPNQAVAKDGRIVWLTTNGVPFLAPDGTLLGYRGIDNDITDRKRAEDALQETLSRLNATLDALPDLLFTVDVDGRIYDYRAPRPELLHVPPEQFIGRRMGEVLPEPAAGIIARAIADAARRGRHQGAVYSLDTPLGVRWFELSIAAQGDPQPPKGRLIILVHDITDRKQAEEQLKAINENLERRVAERTAEVQRRVRQLQSLASRLTLAEERERRRIAQMLHDHLQQTLAAAKFQLQIPLRHVAEKSSHSVIRHVDALLGQALEASRSLTYEIAPPILYELGLRSAVDWLARQMQDRHGLTVHVAAGTWAEVASDDVRIFLYQAVQELLFNVAKHARTSEAEVRLDILGDKYAQVIVSDKGAGFSAAASAAWQGPETSIGMLGIREHIEWLGGRMKVVSGEGRGTQVTLSVPLQVSRTEPNEGRRPGVKDA